MDKKIEINKGYHEVWNVLGQNWEKNKCEDYKEYRDKWTNNPKKMVLEKAPLHLDIEPTSACNLRCPMCTRTILLSENSENFNVCNMDIKQYKNIIDQAVDIGVYAVKLNFRGEPLVHKDIVEMVEYAKEKGVIDVMLNTNATLLTEEMSYGLINAGLDKIFFSFDSPYKENYEKIRVGANYEETLENIKNFVEIRNKLGKNSPLTRTSMVLMDINGNEYEDYVEMFRDIVDVVSYVEYIDPVTKKQKYNEGFLCSQLWQRMVILADGDVVACCNDLEKKYVVGNVGKSKIKDIWLNEKYCKLREMHSNGKYYDIEMCSKCELSVSTND